MCKFLSLVIDRAHSRFENTEYLSNVVFLYLRYSKFLNDDYAPEANYSNILSKIESCGGLFYIVLNSSGSDFAGFIYIDNSYKQINDDDYLVSGKELLEDAFSIMNIEDEEEDLNQTINSWLSKKLSHLPTSGDNFIYQDKWKVFVNSANKKGAVEVSFKKL